MSFRCKVHFQEKIAANSSHFFPDHALLSRRRCIFGAEIKTIYHLAKVDMNEENWKESAESLWSYFEMHEAIMKQRDAESIRKIQSLFNFNQMEEERNRALQGQIRVERIVFLLLIILVGLSISTFIGFGKTQKQKKEREELIMKYREQIAVFIENNELKMQMFENSDIYNNLHNNFFRLAEIKHHFLISQ